MLVLFQDKVLNIGYDFLHIFSLIGCAVDDQIDWAVKFIKRNRQCYQIPPPRKGTQQKIVDGDSNTSPFLAENQHGRDIVHSIYFRIEASVATQIIEHIEAVAVDAADNRVSSQITDADQALFSKRRVFRNETDPLPLH